MEKSFNTRAYNSIELLPFGLVRKSSASDRLSDEVFYYDSIPSDVLHLFPRKKDFYTKDGKHNLVLEYYPYQNLGQHMMCNEVFDWGSVFSNLKSAIDLMREHTEHSDDSEKYASSMYITKTKTEYENLKKTYYDSELFSSEKLVINGKEYTNFEGLWFKVQSLIEKHLLSYRRNMIHGDMCFSNILYHPKVGARFIDMRGSFGARGVYGDTMYDYAKLLHSVEGGYELFINDSFSVERESRGVYNAYLFSNKNKDLAFDAYMQTFADKNIDLIRLVEGLIFVGMCARHYDSEKRQMIMYLTGIKTLNEAVKQLC